MAVTASLSSHVMLNQHLLEAVMGKSPSLRVVFSAYKDFTCILLCPSESGVYKFPKAGASRTSLSPAASRGGFALPARYTAARNPAHSR